MPLSTSKRSRRDAAPLGSWLLGAPDDPIDRRRVRVQTLLTVLLVTANLTGVVVVITLITVVLPGPSIWQSEFALANFVLTPIFVVGAMLIGVVWGTKLAVRELRWALDERTPSREEQAGALALPWRLTALCAVLWAVGAVVHTVAFALIDVETLPKVAITVTFGGLTVCAFCYVLSDFALRPAAARALEAGSTSRPRIVGITGRTTLAWLLGTGVPVVGLMLVAVFGLVDPVTPTQLAVSILAFGGVTLAFGLLLTVFGARATVDPIRSVTHAMAELERGEPGAEVVVYDGTELGELQSGFNRMADGLRERERIRELFGRHVGREVADAALRRQPTLGGEEVEVAVFFIDLLGSTGLAASRPPQQVVELLNSFFEVLVDEVDRQHGIVDKFEGDGALAIFGAPLQVDDAPGRALAAARAIRARLPGTLQDYDAAIGVAYGTAVAGNIGARSRFEYTVIGDPVNEAARLCEAAKEDDARLLASDRTVRAAGDVEAAHWEISGELSLRGRNEPTGLARPRS